MQRTAICLVAVLALLAGCSGGVGGGSDATQTPTPDASPAELGTDTPPSTPMPEPNDTAKRVSAPATTSVERFSANDTEVLEGDMVRFNATISNRNDTVASQSVTVQAGERTVYTSSIELGPEETRTVNLFTLNTSVVEPGEKFVTVSTENDSELFRMDIRPREELETFINDVRSRTRVFENGTALSEDHVLIRYDAKEDQTRYYYGDTFDPVPEAVAFEMATSSYAPEKATLRILPYDGTEDPYPYQTTLNRSLATKLYNGTVDPREFGTILDRRATGEATEVYEPEWLDIESHTWAHEQFTFFSGDRARWAYANEFVERLNATKSDHYAIADHGLYNGTSPLPDSTNHVGPNASIQATLKADNWGREIPYKNSTTTEIGMAGLETLNVYGNLTEMKTYGDRPASLRIRVLWPDGSRRNVIHYPTNIAKEGANSNATLSYFVAILFSDLNRNYDYRLD
jgi:hypothetical protein